MIRLSAIALALVPGIAMAHPGHGAGLHNHVEEIVALAIAGVVAILAVRAWRAR